MTEQYREVPLSNLRLDPHNPRLPRGEEWASQSDTAILRQLLLRYDLIELARSIADKGFTPRHAEALLVIDHPTEPDVYVVVEGNRRLATLKLLTDAELRRELLRSAEWDDLAKDAARHSLASVPVIVYAERTALNDYLGFRHITGPKPWRPEAKARFIASLLSGGESIGDVARRIGSNHHTVRRYAEAHAIFGQAMDAGIDVDRVEAGFGIFYSALDPDGIRDFLGLRPRIEITALPESPVPEERIGHLEDLIGLLYGDDAKQLERVISESRELRKLGEVLSSDEARVNLLRDRDLERAWRSAGGGKADVLGILSDAHTRLAGVSGMSREFAEDEEIQAGVRRIYDLVLDMADRYEVADS